MKTINLTKSQIHEIAENLSVGLKCYYHFPTGEVKTVFPNEDGDFDEDDEESGAIEILSDFDNYFEFEPMATRESFQMMEDFIETISDTRFANRLVYALNNRKPFRHFKEAVESSNYRQNWFNFRDECQDASIEKQIRRHNYFLSDDEIEV